MGAEINFAEAMASLHIGDRNPTWREYEKAAPCEQRAIVRRWREIAERGRTSKEHVRDAHRACSNLFFIGKPFEHSGEIYEAERVLVREHEAYLRSLPHIDINAIGDEYDTRGSSERKQRRDDQLDYEEDQNDQLLGGRR